MTREPHSKAVSRHTTFSRVLTFLLLGFIVYGTTIEAAHRHGNLSVKNIESLASLSNSHSEADSNGGVTGCNDCLICQLHQHFSTSVIPNLATVETEAIRSASVSPITVAVRSHINAIRTGRAPPQIS